MLFLVLRFLLLVIRLLYMHSKHANQVTNGRCGLCARDYRHVTTSTAVFVSFLPVLVPYVGGGERISGVWFPCLLLVVPPWQISRQHVRIFTHNFARVDMVLSCPLMQNVGAWMCSPSHAQALMDLKSNAVKPGSRRSNSDQ